MNRRTGFSISVLLLVCSALYAQNAPTSPSAAPDPREIVRESVTRDTENYKLEKNYTYQKRVDRTINGKREILTYDVLPVYGEIYEKLIARDDKPLSDKEAHKEEEKIDKLSNKLRDESDSAREKRVKKEEEERQRDHEYVQEIPKAFDFKLVRSDVVNGRDVWVIDATPRPDFHSDTRLGKILPKVKGRVYIDKQEYQWVKVEVDFIDDVSLAIGLAKINKGAAMEFDAKKVNDEVWLPVEYRMAASARLLFAHKDIQESAAFNNYRKYTADAKIVGEAQEVTPQVSNQPK